MQKTRAAFKKPVCTALPTPQHVASKNKLVFSPKAWVKILYMRDRGKTEVSGFGISSEDDPLHIIDFKLLPQLNWPTFTEFDDKASPAYLEDMYHAGFQPNRCFRVWIHTHPGMTASPSGHDHDTFERTTEMASWGVMCIVADRAYAKLIVNADGLSGTRELTVTPSMTGVFEGVTEEDYVAWEAEYCECVNICETTASSCMGPIGDYDHLFENPGAEDDYEDTRLKVDKPFDETMWSEEVVAKFDITGEIVQMMEEGDNGYFYVFTSTYWFEFGNSKVVHCGLNEILVNFDSISDKMPLSAGRVKWNDEDDTPILFDIDPHEDEDEVIENAEEEAEERRIDEIEQAAADESARLAQASKESIVDYHCGP